MDTATLFLEILIDAHNVNEIDSALCGCLCLFCTSVVITQAATVTDAWAPSASRCLTCLGTLLSAAGLVYFISLAVVH